MDAIELTRKLNNEELLNKLIIIKKVIKEQIKHIRSLVEVMDIVKFELMLRSKELEKELKTAEFDRLKSDEVFFNHLLDLH